MERRDFLKVMGAVSLAGCASVQARPGHAEITIQTAGRGARLDPSFFGLSFESTLLSFPGVFYRENDSLVALLRQLSDEGVIRLGGHYGQYGFWTRNKEAMSQPFRYQITPADVDRFAGFMKELDWKVVYGLNLGNGDPDRIADEAAYVSEVLGDQLDALQLGHEPDTYVRRGLRAARYGVNDYIGEWKRAVAAVRERFAEASFAGPDTANVDWLEAFAQECGPQLQFLSHHDYAMNSNRDDTDLATLLARNPAALQSGPARVARLMQHYHLPGRVTEGGSMTGAGRIGISDSLGSALWGINHLYQLFSLGYEGMYFHAGPGGSVSPIVRDARTMRFVPRPLYYAMLFVRQTMPGQLVNVHLNTRHPDLRAWAVVDHKNQLKLALLNLSASDSVDVEFTADRRISGGEVLRLQGAGLAQKSGISFAGSVARASSPWQAQIKDALETTLTGGRLQVPAASAALVVMN